jgi:hypothetical protein
MYVCMYVGLYERDKTSFKLIMTFKILLTANKLDSRYITLFLRGGSALVCMYVCMCVCMYEVNVWYYIR